MKIELPITVVAFETDFGGVVSNTRYLEYIERGRYALLHAAGLLLGWTLRPANVWVPRLAGAGVAAFGVSLLVQLA